MRALPPILCLPLAAASAACLRGSGALVEDANARVIVTGADAGASLQVAVEGQPEPLAVETPPEAVREGVTFYFALPPGDAEVRVTLGDEGGRRCGRFALAVPEDGRVTHSVDVAALSPCDQPHLLELVERVVDTLCVLSVCDEVTIVDEGGDLTFDGILVSASSPLVEEDLAALEAEVLASDELFGGADPQCPQPRPDEALEVTLSRRVERDGGVVEESVAVHGCTGAAEALRDRLAFLRRVSLEVELSLE